ncbi:copper chaperone PCu(A)C [Streptomyces sp. NPDC050704]|uniref:copper chaperone PCu(A)C n=1 Tax=Streptomyces sp. NPDC050704 TaxID=3157219 RepID=UPI003413FA79
MTSASAAPADRPAPLWRRLAASGAVRSALIPTGTCAAVLLLLTAYTATGAAGDPPQKISVSDGRIFQPADSANTAAFFYIRNTGGDKDTLESVSSLDLGVTVLARTVSENGESRTKSIDPVTVPAGGSLRMDPSTIKVTVLDPPSLELGEKVRFDLWFQNSGRVRVTAVTVSPGPL